MAHQATASDQSPPGAGRVLTVSTIAFTVMFAVWTMFGILAKPIRAELHLSEAEYSWILAAAILNGSMWRLPAGMLTDRIGGRKVMVVMLAATAVPAYLVSVAHSYAALLVLAFLVGFAGNSFSVGIAWNAAWTARRQQGFALGVFGAGNVGASVTKFIGPPLIVGTTGASYFGFLQGGWRLVPVIYAALLVLLAVLTLLITPRHDRKPGSSKPMSEMLARCASCGSGASASTTSPCSAPTSRCPAPCPRTTRTTSASRSPRPGCSPPCSSSRRRCCGRWAAGSPTASARARRCTARSSSWPSPPAS
ncbi:hypothetical protein GCM10025862_00780 [Arsenicicoccus piscis]|uniref:Major facilitator superfamily (MFS) profile domain-containing protein n=1 Tax=Arsenicicoccus piscis TaxID=673954 RepID=A0ABQ6HHV8_9MICO|nr:hypothetical protein GCM10025862_00780 [Arsenicicoccus piscis]